MKDELTNPLADRMRPRQLDEYIGQQHILKQGKPLYEAIKSGHLHSMIFWCRFWQNHLGTDHRATF